MNFVSLKKSQTTQHKPGVDLIIAFRHTMYSQDILARKEGTSICSEKVMYEIVHEL